MAKKKDAKLAEATQEWHNNVVDDTPDKKFTPKVKLGEIPADLKPAIAGLNDQDVVIPTFPHDDSEDAAQAEPEEIKRVPLPEVEIPTFPHAKEEVKDYPAPMQWVDDWTLLKEVVKINTEFRGYGNDKKIVKVFYGELK